MMDVPKIILISAGDATYSPLAHDLFASLRAQSFPFPLDYGLLDVGFVTEQRMHFESLGIKVVPVGSDIDFPRRAEWEAKKPGIRTLTARPFLRRYFPGYDIYIWLDADVWVQTPEAIMAMVAEAARSSALCIAPELDRCYPAFFQDTEIWRRFHGWYEACYSEEIVGKMALKPMLNAGVFCMNAQSPLWDAWAQIYAEALQNTRELTDKTFMTDQLGLNILLYLYGMPCVVMPARYNWLTYYALPKLDTATGLYVEPQIPCRPISQFHLTRPNKLAVEHIECLDGSVVDRPLIFSASSHATHPVRNT